MRKTYKGGVEEERDKNRKAQRATKPAKREGGEEEGGWREAR